MKWNLIVQASNGRQLGYVEQASCNWQQEPAHDGLNATYRGPDARFFCYEF
jgi:hypothetical protein